MDLALFVMFNKSMNYLRRLNREKTCLPQPTCIEEK